MGFWGVLGRMIQGKPAFEMPPPEDRWDDDSDAPVADYSEERRAKKQQALDYEKGLVDEKGVKQIPVAEVINVNTDNNGQNIDLWVTVRNQSNRELRLGSMTLLGTKFDLNYPLKAADQRVFRVYSGPQLTHDNYKKAELYYRDEMTGYYFRADHLLQYKYENDKTYDVVGMQLITPINDV